MMNAFKYVRRYLISSILICLATMEMYEANFSTTFVLAASQQPLYSLPPIIQRVILVTSTLYEDRRMLSIGDSVSADLTTLDAHKAYLVQLPGLFHQAMRQDPTATKLTFYVPVDGSSIENLIAYGPHGTVQWHAKRIAVDNWSETFGGRSNHWTGTVTEHVTEVATQFSMNYWSDDIDMLTFNGADDQNVHKVTYSITYPVGGSSGVRDNVTLVHGFTISGGGGGTGLPIPKTAVCYATVKWGKHAESFIMKNR